MAGGVALTDEVRDRVVEALSRGASRRAAANHAGVSEATLAEWVRRGEQAGEKSTRLVAFARAVEVAEGMGELALVENIRLAGQGACPGDWKASAWLLERRYPERYGRRGAVSAGESVPAAVEEPRAPVSALDELASRRVRTAAR